MTPRPDHPRRSPPRRGLGWDVDSPYAGPRGTHFPLGSYGHTGWTGTSLWIDPFSKTSSFSSRIGNHPDESGNVIALRRRLGTLAAEAVIGFNFAYVPGALPALTNAAAAAGAPPTGLTTSTDANANHTVLNGIATSSPGKGFAPLRGCASVSSPTTPGTIVSAARPSTCSTGRPA